jgi:hypothetical protein
LKEDTKKLVGYCGLYCGACGIRQGRVKRGVENLRRVIYAYGFNKIAPDLAKWEPSLTHYAKFEEVMDGLEKLFGGCPGCVDGGGNPGCVIRTCCKEKGSITCADCAEMEKCEKLKQYGQVSERLREIKTKGVDNWTDEMQKKVDAGFCYLDERMK